MTQNAPDGATPVIKGDSEPAKTLPTDPGGKQFAHTDSKIMGRLGEGAPSGGAAADAASADLDANGARRVQTLVVGSDGSMAPPAAPDGPVTTGTVSVPGLTVVDGFGGRFPGAGQPPAAEATPVASPAAQTPQATPAAASEPIVVEPPAAKPEPEPEPTPEVVANVAPPAPPAAAAQEEAAPEPPTQTVGAAATSTTGANGYVAVLASIPASGGSRLSALKKFADMQEKYGSVLQNKTPDVQEANLGERGTYHRLLVGPPGSRSQASGLCSDLKSAGYKDCWVTAY
jgi:hypothetical protein